MEKKEYIEREKLLTVLEELFHATDPCGEEQFGYLKAHRIVREAPAADVVEVVRCKDCALRKTEDCMMYYECDCGEQHTWESDNDYCSHGERKEE